DSLVEVCGHDHNQAENCAIIAHYKGKCHIKKGNLDVIRPIYVEMTNRQITVEIV
ncbi:MAG: ATP-dependent Clp protease adaptor ClpS, partial [Lentimicrobiaceae bacterium]|nr:ATP-dependent Clp protease adaptor ClpS [Lentimicrobiaceae bacterium]